MLAASFAMLAGVAQSQDASKSPAHREPAATTKNDSPDAWLTMKVKLALLTAKDVPGLAIDVDTQKDVVTLSGKVSTATEKTRAEEVAKGVDGVKEVKNLVQVVPGPERKVVDQADDKIKDALQKKLDADKAFSGISVKSVDKGVVLLAGKATTAAALRAVQVVHATAGVRQVSSEIELER
jgi:hyperosmotically inducible protein